MPKSTDQFRSFCKKYIASYTHGARKQRGVGVEKEIPAVDKDGFMANIPEKIWPYLQEKGFEEITDSFYKEEIVGFAVGKDQIALDAGKGTFELILAPYSTVQKAEEQFKKLLNILYEVCKKADVKLLGIGYQPRNKAFRKSWNRKQRYEVLLDMFGDDVYAAALSASDQVHVDVAIDEVIPVVNTMNGLAAFMIVLFANSPFREGKPNGYKVNRELIWDDLYRNRTGVPVKPFSSLEDYLAEMWELNCIMAEEKGEFYSPKVRFRNFAGGFGPMKTFNAFKMHEGSIWFCARPRFFGTVEVRPACLQPWNDMVAVAAFTLGIIQNYKEAEMFLKDFRWSTLRQLRYEVAQKGFDCEIGGRSMADCLKEILLFSEKGLIKRKRGEEVYLKSLFKRVASEKSPADVAIEYYRKGGMSLVLDKIALQKRHLK